jgi:hypothetical protein
MIDENLVSELINPNQQINHINRQSQGLSKIEEEKQKNPNEDIPYIMEI